MKSLSKWLSAMVVLVMLANVAMAVDAVSAGKIKSVNGEKKEFVLTDAANKDWNFKLADDVIINRSFKESKTDLKEGDAVKVFYDKGLTVWTASYILVAEGDTKNCELIRGAVKTYDKDTKDLTFKTDDNKELTFKMADVKVRLNRQDSKVDEMKIGDRALAIVEEKDGKQTLKWLMIDRK